MKSQIGARENSKSPGKKLACLLALPAGALLAGGVAHAAENPPRIPLCAGLQIVTAINQANGDYESIKTVESVTESTVRIKYSAERLVTDMMAPDLGSVRKYSSHRTLRAEDLKSAVLYQQVFSEDMPETVPETTAVGTSSAVLNSLKTGGHADFSVSNAYSGAFPIDRSKHPNIYDYMTKGELKNVGEAAFLPVIVNGVSTQLPAVHAAGDFVGDHSEFFFLNDEANPLTLKYRIGVDAIPPANKESVAFCETLTKKLGPETSQALCGRLGGGDRDTLQVVKITYRCSEPPPLSASQPPAGTGQPPSAAGQPQSEASELEKQLASGGKVEIYDIHFSFNSDQIREESQPRLAEIADVLRKHPDWVLAVGGHTDSVGGTDYNQKLSERRAAAVKTELVQHYGVKESRLSTSGYGASQPRDTNDTLEGRARNRRVELVKL